MCVKLEKRSHFRKSKAACKTDGLLFSCLGMREDGSPIIEDQQHQGVWRDGQGWGWGLCRGIGYCKIL